MQPQVVFKTIGFDCQAVVSNNSTTEPIRTRQWLRRYMLL